MRAKLRYTIYMNVQSSAQKITLVSIAIVLIVLAVVYFITHNGSFSAVAPSPKPLSPDQAQRILDQNDAADKSLKKLNPTTVNSVLNSSTSTAPGPKPLTPEQIK